jgi:radical SAM superfamily enzyme YgiQ (UPF0313 family)
VDKYGITNFYFAENMINGNSQRLAQISSLLTEEGLAVCWGGLARVQRFSEGLFNAAYRAGCRFLEFGIESGSQRILNLMKKGISLHDASAVLKAAHQAGIWTQVFLIIGFPGESTRSLSDTTAFIRDNAKWISSIYVSQFSLVPFSDIAFNQGKYVVKNVKANSPRLENLLLMESYDFERTDGMANEDLLSAIDTIHDLASNFGILTPIDDFYLHMFDYAYDSGEFH